MAAKWKMTFSKNTEGQHKSLSASVQLLFKVDHRNMRAVLFALKHKL